MIRACIDIGTNSVKLLVADVRDQQIVNILRYQTATTRIGQGVDETRQLLPEAIDRTVAAIEALKQEAELLGVSRLTPVATSAVRDAQNKDVFIQKVMERTGLKPLVLSGDEEARLTFVGVCSNRPELRTEKLILVDVGGGSSDFVVAQNGEVEDKFSVRAGFIRLTEAFMHSDPVTTAEVQKAVRHVKNLLHHHFVGISTDERLLVGVGGTINFLATILYWRMGQYAVKSGQTRHLQRNEITGMLKFLSRMTLEELKQVPGLPPDRADVIVAGVAIFSAIMETLDAEKIMVSDRSMRYGVLLSEDL